jgi:hypothetical protein
MTPHPGRFTVELIGKARTDFDGLAALADRFGLRRILSQVVRELLENLETQPREWGDPYSNFPALSAVGYGKTMTPTRLRITYSVHNTERLVWVSGIRALEGSPFHRV